MTAILMTRAPWVSLCCLLAGVGLTQLGCSDLAPESDNCETTGILPCPPANGGSGGTEQNIDALVPDNWKCLLKPDATYVPSVPTPAPTGVAYVVAILDFQLPDPTRPPVGFDIDLCAITDASCDSPITQAPIGPVQAAGAPPALYQIGMRYNFEGFIKVTAPDYVRQDYYFGGPMLGQADGMLAAEGTMLVRSDYITLIGQNALANFHRDASIVQEAGTGILGVTVGDCNGARAEGVTLEQLVQEGQSLDGVGWTYRDGVVQQTDPPPTTDARAVTGFANVRKGNIEVQANIKFGDRTFSFGRRVFRIRGNQVTGGRIWPGIGERGL